MTGSKGILFTATYVDAFYKMDEHIKQQAQQCTTNTNASIRDDVQSTKDQEQFNQQMQQEITGIRHIVGIETKTGVTTQTKCYLQLRNI